MTRAYKRLGPTLVFVAASCLHCRRPIVVSAWERPGDSGDLIPHEHTTRTGVEVRPCPHFCPSLHPDAVRQRILIMATLNRWYEDVEPM